MSPLSSTLEAQILALAKRDRIVALPISDPTDFDLADAAEALADSIRIVDGATVVPVWNGASARTVWSSPVVNWTFRALHDSHHVLTGAGFDADGERSLALFACEQIQGETDRAILWAEVWGQVEYFERWGMFPTDQRAFVRAFVSDAARTIAQGVFHGSH